jgi:hypothetical protein
MIEIFHDPEPYSVPRIDLAPCSPVDLMKRCAQLARQYKGVNLHTYLVETIDENRFLKKSLACVRCNIYKASVGRVTMLGTNTCLHFRIDDLTHAGGMSGPVWLSVINGQIVVEDGQIPELDIPALLKRHNEISQTLLIKSEAASNLSNQSE